jgi:hypothetical protein
MVPVPASVVSKKEIAKEPRMKHRFFLDWELNYCRANIDTILSTARFVYDAVVNKNHKNHDLMVQVCCDFSKTRGSLRQVRP